MRPSIRWDRRKDWLFAGSDARAERLTLKPAVHQFRNFVRKADVSYIWPISSAAKRIVPISPTFFHGDEAVIEIIHLRRM
jgi:hypothetical protein